MALIIGVNWRKPYPDTRAASGAGGVLLFASGLTWVCVRPCNQLLNNHLQPVSELLRRAFNPARLAATQMERGAAVWDNSCVFCSDCSERDVKLPH